MHSLILVFSRVQSLASPTRRLVCYCRLYDVGPAEANSDSPSPSSSPSPDSPSEQKQLMRAGSFATAGVPTVHLTLASSRSKQREIFLFNDLLLVC